MLHLQSLQVRTFNSHDLYTNYKAIIPPEAVLEHGVEVNEVFRFQSPPLFSGKVIKSRTIPLRIGIINASGTADELKSIFDVSDQSLRTLVVLDTSTNIEWQVYATPAMPPTFIDRTTFETALYVPDAVWTAVDSVNSPWYMTGTFSQTVVTGSGNKNVNPKYYFVPVSYPNGTFAYQEHISIYNPTDKHMNIRPVDLMNASWNTQGLVTGSFLRSDGADIDVMVDGNLANFWLGNYNTTTTRLWVNLNFGPGISFSMATGTSIALGGTVDYIYVAPYVHPTTPTPEPYEDPLDNLPPRGCLRVDNEEFLYTSINRAMRRFTLSARAARGTTAAAHSAGATVRWIEHEVIVLYSNPGAVARSISNTRKPVFNLNTSTNAEKYYPYPSTALGFGDEDRLEAGSFKLSVQKSIGKRSEYYGGISGTYSSIFNVMGLHMATWKIGGRYQAEDAILEGRITDPAGIAYVNASGTKKNSRTTAWPENAGLQSSLNGTTWTNQYDVPAPSTSGSWQGWTSGLLTMPTGTMHIRFVMDGAIAAGQNAYLETRAATVISVSGSVPQVTPRTAVQTYYADFTLTNASTGQWMHFNIPMTQGHILAVDTDNKTIHVDNVPVAASPDLSTKRGTWLYIQEGANTIQFSSANGGGRISGSIEWNDRSL